MLMMPSLFYDASIKISGFLTDNCTQCVVGGISINFDRKFRIKLV